MPGKRVASDVRCERAQMAITTMPITPRQNTSSEAVKLAEANLTPTAIVAKNSDAASIQRACIRPYASLSGTRGVQAHGLAVPLVEVLHAVFHRALVGADLVVAALQQCLAARVHAQRDLVVLHAGLHVGG